MELTAYIFLAIRNTRQRCLLTALILFAAATFCAGTVFASPISDIFAVWSVPVADRRTIIKYAWLENGHWTAPAILPIDKGLHVTPVIVPGNDRSIWIIWVEQTADENILRYAIIRDETFLTGRVQDRSNEQSFAPNVFRDRDGTIWITWSEVVKRFADVFTSQWHGSAWDKPQLVNKDNDAPDFTPVIGADETGTVWVSWFGFTADHRFVQYRSEYRDEQWHTLPETASGTEIKDFIETRSVNVTDFPEDFRTRLMGAVFNCSGNPSIQSVSDYFRLTHTPRR